MQACGLVWCGVCVCRCLVRTERVSRRTVWGIGTNFEAGGVRISGTCENFEDRCGRDNRSAPPGN